MRVWKTFGEFWGKHQQMGKFQKNVYNSASVNMMWKLLFIILFIDLTAWEINQCQTSVKEFDLLFLKHNSKKLILKQSLIITERHKSFFS